MAKATAFPLLALVLGSLSNSLRCHRVFLRFYTMPHCLSPQLSLYRCYSMPQGLSSHLFIFTQCHIMPQSLQCHRATMRVLCLFFSIKVVCFYLKIQRTVSSSSPAFRSKSPHRVYVFKLVSFASSLLSSLPPRPVAVIFAATRDSH